MRKAYLSLIISLLLFLNACSPASIAPTSTTTATNTATYAPTNTLTPSPTSTATITPTSTPDISALFYPGLAPSIEIFDEHFVEKSQIAAIIADLRSKPSLLDADATPIDTSLGGSDLSKAISVNCNIDGVSCIPAASISIFEDGYIRDIIIWEIKNADGTRGYLSGWAFGGPERTGTKGYERVLNDPTGYRFLHVGIWQATSVDTKYPYARTLLEQENFTELSQKFLESGVVPLQLEKLIALITT